MATGLPSTLKMMGGGLQAITMTVRPSVCRRHLRFSLQSAEGAAAGNNAIAMDWPSVSTHEGHTLDCL